jgi:hypothetical protein
MAFITQGAAQVLETVSGVSAGVTFSFEARPARGDWSAVFQAKSGTTISADLQISLDGGTTWTNYAAGFFAAAGAKALAAASTTPPLAGALYRLNYTTLTGTWTILVTSN